MGWRSKRNLKGKEDSDWRGRGHSRKSKTKKTQGNKLKAKLKKEKGG